MATKSFSSSSDLKNLEEDAPKAEADHIAKAEKDRKDSLTTDLVRAIRLSRFIAQKYMVCSCYHSHLGLQSTIKAGDSYGATWPTQFMYMYIRATKQNLRDLLPFIIGLVISIIFGLLLAGIFANLGDDQASIQDRQGLLFFIIVNQAFGSIFGVINTFPAEK